MLQIVDDAVFASIERIKDKRLRGPPLNHEPAVGRQWAADDAVRSDRNRFSIAEVHYETSVRVVLLIGYKSDVLSVRQKPSPAIVDVVESGD